MCLCVFGTVWGVKMASTCSEKRNSTFMGCSKSHASVLKTLKQQYTKSSSIGYVQN